MFKKISKYKITSGIFALSFIFVAGAMAWAYAALGKTSGLLILHFNNAVGINQIGGFRELVGAGVTGIVLVAVNFAIALELERRDWFLGKLLAAATLLLSVFLFIGFAAIISVN